ncbi:MAG TPA: ATP-binding cassette domain-containing protein [Chitinispirillaceae bacterium]|nr:ATP-binding cassette domain-containing protein [Chitinispirillaceae bacterium]
MSKKEPPLILMDNVSVRLWNRTVFKNISWSIYQNQFWAVTGITGSGKSILARALCGDYPLAGGEIVYNFKECDNPFLFNDPLKRIGYVAFETNRDMKSDQNRFVQSRYWSNGESLSVKKYLSKEMVYEINPFEIVKNRRALSSYYQLQKKLLKLFQIDYLLNREVESLSNGECRKVAMVHELLREPVLLILDNPFQGLDSEYRIRLCNIILPFLIKQGTVCMIITSDKSEIHENVTHLLEVDSFRIISSGLYRHSSVKKNRLKKQQSVIFEMTAGKSIPDIFQRRVKSPETLVRMSHVYIKSGRKVILNDISWEIRKGEHWALTGPNGCGKTTLLSLIIGDHPQMYANVVEIFGVRWGRGSNIWNVKKKIGWVSPELQICYPGETTGLNVVLSGYYDSIGLFNKPSKEKKNRVADLFSEFGISELAEVAFGSMSEGHQRLLLLLRAMVKSPLMLVLDEPCQGLPFAARKFMISTIDKLACCNTTIIYVTHQLNELPSCINKKLTLTR